MAGKRWSPVGFCLIALAACGGETGTPVGGDTTPPTVSSTSPASNATGVATNSAVQVTFSETMKAATLTTGTYTLSGGGSVTGTVAYSGATATFTPSSNLSASTLYTATITTGVKDLAGNAVASAYTWSFTTGTVSDTTPPTVSATSPVSDATGVAVDSTIQVAFSETMNATTLTPATVTLSGGCGVTGTVAYFGTTATFTPSSDLSFSTTYTATITTGVRDLAGNAIASVYTWSFTTSLSPGALDSSFGVCGKVTTAIGSGQDWANALAIQSDGKIVAAGHSRNGSDADFALVRYNTNGTLDSSFGTGGKVTTAIGGSDDSVNALGVQSDGKIVAAGYFITPLGGGDYDFALARYNTNGTLDSSFGTGGKVTTAIGSGQDWANALAIQSDGKIVVVGHSHNGTDYDFVLARYNTDGTLDPSFGTGGKVTTDIGSGDFANALGIQSDGKIVAAGRDTLGSATFALARYNTNGVLDSSFGTGGKVTTAFGGGGFAHALGIQSDGKIIAAGYAAPLGNSNFVLARYNTNGTLDSSFDTDGRVTTDLGGDEIATALAIQGDGKIVVAGYLYNGSDNLFALVRYDTNGSLDTSFDTDGKVTTVIAGNEIATALAIQSDGKIVAAGYSGTGSSGDFTLVRYWP